MKLTQWRRLVTDEKKVTLKCRQLGGAQYSAQWGDKTFKNIFLIKTFNFSKLASEFGWSVTPRRDISTSLYTVQ